LNIFRSKSSNKKNRLKTGDSHQIAQYVQIKNPLSRVDLFPVCHSREGGAKFNRIEFELPKAGPKGRKYGCIL
jgi:hypothetical protein